MLYKQVILSILPIEAMNNDKMPQHVLRKKITQGSPEDKVLLPRILFALCRERFDIAPAAERQFGETL